MQVSVTAPRQASQSAHPVLPSDEHERAVADLLSHAADAGFVFSSKVDEAALELLGESFRNDDQLDQILISAAATARDIDAGDMSAEAVVRLLLNIGQAAVTLTRSNAARLVMANDWQEVA